MQGIAQYGHGRKSGYLCSPALNCIGQLGAQGLALRAWRLGPAAGEAFNVPPSHGPVDPPTPAYLLRGVVSDVAAEHPSCAGLGIGAGHSPPRNSRGHLTPPPFPCVVTVVPRLWGARH